jgi:hypothetical protein
MGEGGAKCIQILEKKKNTRRPRYRWEVNTKMDLKEMQCEVVAGLEVCPVTDLQKL